VSPAPAASGGESLTVNQWLQRLAPEYLNRFGPAMPGRQRQVLRKILSCRTPARGGELWACPDGHFLYRYHSCNDRHCPLCGQTDADDWLQRQRARLLLPVPYFLVTFTVPEELRLLIRAHLQIALDLLFATSAQALQDLAGNPKRLGAQLGMLGVLHTWSRTLIFHPHLHFLVPGGGLSPDGRQWIAARNQFLLHHQALGDRCRTLFQARLQKEHPELFNQVPAKVWKRHWNVGCQAAGSGENALRYLSRYVFKTATHNRTVRQLPDGRLRWPYRDSRTGRDTAIALQPLDFMARFLQHILPRHFARVRTFGWLHPAAKLRANRVRALLHQQPLLTPAEQQTWQPPPDPEEQTLQLLGAAKPSADRSTLNPLAGRSQAQTAQPVLCPHCQKPMLLVGSWKAGQTVLFPKRPP
jgi:hypothetical protein